MATGVEPIPNLKYVGKNKARRSDKDLAPKRLPRLIPQDPNATTLTLKDYDLVMDEKPSFNVCYVQLPQLRLPAPFAAFVDLLKETYDFVRPVLRFGIPETSLKDKCKWWREDGEPLVTTPGVRLRATILNEDFMHQLHMRRAKEKQEAGIDARGPLHGGHSLSYSHIHTGLGDKHGRHGPMRMHMPSPEFLMSEVSGHVVLALNIFCWYWLTTPPRRGGGM